MEQPNLRTKTKLVISATTLILLFLASEIGHAEDVARFIASDTPQGGGHALGFIKDDPKTYRALKPVKRFRAFYPVAWDLATFMPPPGNQGRQASCVAWAVGYAARSYYLKKDYNADTTLAENVLSPAYIYNSLREPKGDCSGGTSISRALNLVKNSGGVPLNELPYNQNECLSVPQPATLERYADRFRIKGYRRVEGSEQDDIKGQLYSGNPVIFAIDIPRAFDHYTSSSAVIDDLDDRGENFGHAMVIIGYDDTKQAYHFVNSWGPHWGQHGFGWISYRSAAALWQGGYVMEVDAPTPPPPAPSPPPGPEPPTPPPVPLLTPPEVDVTSPCSHLEALITQSDDSYIVKLSGFVDKSEDLERIRTAALRKAGVKGVETGDVVLTPWPQCEALLTLATALENAHGANITREPTSGILRKGDHVTIQIVSPDYPSYIYVAYIQADGTAAHLLRPTAAGVTPPNTTIRLGDESGPIRYRIGFPYGHEMVVLLAAKQPLFDESLMGPVRERDLLTAYRRVLLGPGGNQASAAIATLETAE